MSDISVSYNNHMKGYLDNMRIDAFGVIDNDISMPDVDKVEAKKSIWRMYKDNKDSVENDDNGERKLTNNEESIKLRIDNFCRSSGMPIKMLIGSN